MFYSRKNTKLKSEKHQQLWRVEDAISACVQQSALFSNNWRLTEESSSHGCWILWLSLLSGVLLWWIHLLLSVTAVTLSLFLWISAFVFIQVAQYVISAPAFSSVSVSKIKAVLHDLILMIGKLKFKDKYNLVLHFLAYNVNTNMLPTVHHGLCTVPYFHSCNCAK